MSRERIPADVRKLAKELAQAKLDARRLACQNSFRKCSKIVSLPARLAGHRHGPYYSITRVEGGKTRCM